MGILSIFIWPILLFAIVMLYLYMKKHGVNFFKRIGIVFLFLLPFTYDIMITNILSAYYCLISPPNPKTYIKKKVEYPESIYWEDNVYPGFSKEDRGLMIINYLDGVHLKTMALNGPDNKKVYVYHLAKPLYKEFIKKYLITHPDIHIGNFKVYKAYANEIMKTEQIFTKQTMPKTNYTVTFSEIKLNSFARKFLYSDETKVIENNTSKVIAYNRRYMRFFYNIMPDFVGDRYYYPHVMCGLSYMVDEDVLIGIWRLHGYGRHQISLNKKLYKKYIKGEE